MTEQTDGGYERFVREDGYLYDTEEARKEAFARQQKARRGVLLTQEEFDAEVRSRFGDKDTGEVYQKLAELVNANVMKAHELYAYAKYGWCMNDPASIIWYQVGRDRYMVNNCGTSIEKSDAIVKICLEWGFEASRVNIIGTPYYDATDWQFIRFNCAGMAWLWTEEMLYKVYQ